MTTVCLKALRKVTCLSCGSWTRHGSGNRHDKGQRQTGIWIFASLAEFERELIRERTIAGLASARARGHVGGRKAILTKAKIRMAQAAMGSVKLSFRTSAMSWGLLGRRSTDMSVRKGS